MGTIFWRNTLAISVWLSLALWVSPTLAQEFYKGKTIRLIVATTPGGGFDAYSRAIARHMNKHIPGNPTIIVENMPGAGMLIGTNYIYKQAKPDGLTIGNFTSGLLLQQLFGAPGSEFDGQKLEYIGVGARYVPVVFFTKASGITSMNKWLAAGAPLKLGGTAPGPLRSGPHHHAVGPPQWARNNCQGPAVARPLRLRLDSRPLPQ